MNITIYITKIDSYNFYFLGHIIVHQENCFVFADTPCLCFYIRDVIT